MPSVKSTVKSIAAISSLLSTSAFCLNLNHANTLDNSAALAYPGETQTLELTSLPNFGNGNIGAPNEGPSIKIVGGNPEVEGAHPWMTFLYSYREGSNNGGVCGGSLIADKWVLTAAHCINPQNDVTLAWIGRHNFRNSSQGVEIKVKRHIMHPGYNDATNVHDIALYELEEAVPTSIVSRYAQLPTTQLTNNYSDTGDILKVIGWGTTSEGGSISDTLLKVNLPVVSESSCRSTYSNVSYSRQICAGYNQGGKDSCQGDSGGPLLFSVGGEDYVSGVVSYGRGCARRNTPGVYTRVTSYIDWINSYVKGDSSDDNSNNDVELANGQSIFVSGSKGQSLIYKIDVPAGQSLEISLAGGSGDADLSTRFGSHPTASSYDCRPYKSGNNETCNYDSTEAGTYYILLSGYNNFSGATLTATYGAGNTPPPTGGFTVSDVTASEGLWTQSWSIDMPAGVSSFKVNISGNNGDADLYVQKGSEPGTVASSAINTATQCVPWKTGSNESCSISNPSAGKWYIRVNSYKTFSGLTLTTNYK